jgi:hypothetical protein
MFTRDRAGQILISTEPRSEIASRIASKPQ